MAKRSSQSIYGDFGVVHVSVLRRLAKMTHCRARRFLKGLWFTKSEQSELMHRAEELSEREKKKQAAA